MRLFMVRHGETEWNSERRLQGQADAPLSDKGRAQATALAPLFANGFAPDVVVTSDLPRATATAAILGFPEARLDARFREINVGQWTARLIADIRAEDEAAYKGWRAGSFTPPEGETWAVFKGRVAEGVRTLAAEGHESALVVAHGGVIRAACEALIDLSPSKVVPVGPATVTIFDVEDGEDGLVARLEGFNLAPHAPDLGAPD